MGTILRAFISSNICIERMPNYLFVGKILGRVFLFVLQCRRCETHRNIGSESPRTTAVGLACRSAKKSTFFAPSSCVRKEIRRPKQWLVPCSWPTDLTKLGAQVEPSRQAGPALVHRTFFTQYINLVRSNSFSLSKSYSQ